MDTPGTTEDGCGPIASNLKQLSSQLDQWRNGLSPELKWPEDDPTVFPESIKVTRSYFQPLDPSLTTSSEGQQPAPLFTIDVDRDPVQYPYVYDIQVAFLRTRFYYAKYIVNRPFVYKALHFPDQMTPADMQGVEICLKVRLYHEALPELHSFHHIVSLTTEPVMPQVANRSVTRVTAETRCATPLLLDAGLLWHPPHPTPESSRASSAQSAGSARELFRVGCGGQYRAHAGLDPRPETQRSTCGLLLSCAREHLCYGAFEDRGNGRGRISVK